MRTESRSGIGLWIKPALDPFLWISLWILWITWRSIHRSGGRSGSPRDKIAYVSASELASVPAAQLPTELSESVILLDVRENEEWQQGHAPGAVHIPMAEVPSRIEEIDANAELYVVCKAGGRSLRVVEYLAQIGYAATNVDGGMLAWHDAGRPLVRDDDAEARIL